jgi:hypothetical protein
MKQILTLLIALSFLNVPAQKQDTLKMPVKPDKGVITTDSSVAAGSVPPEIICPGDKDLYTDPGSCSYTVHGSLLNAKAYPGNKNKAKGIHIVNDFNNKASLDGAIFPKGTTTLLWTVTDTNKNTAQCSYTVQVTDNEAPVIRCPADQVRTITPDMGGFYHASGTEFDAVNISDNCSGFEKNNDYNALRTLDNAVFEAGIKVITWFVDDAGGNRNKCSFKLTVLNK